MGSSKKVMQPIAQLKCLYTDTGNMGNKQEELETTVQLENYDLIAINGLWGKSHNWNHTAIKGYKLFKRDGLRRGRGLMLPSVLRNG